MNYLLHQVLFALRAKFVEEIMLSYGRLGKKDGASKLKIVDIRGSDRLMASTLSRSLRISALIVLVAESGNLKI